MSTTLPGGTLSERPATVKALRVYLRQSREEDQQRESIPTQRALCAGLAESLGLRDSWPARVEYVDLDRAGDDFTGREALARLLRDTDAGDVVLAWKQDRVGRDMIDSTATIRELVKYRRCALYTVETGTVPVTLDSAEQTAMVMFRGMVAQGELERIRSRTRDSLRQRARDGFATGNIPFGFRTVPVDPSAKDRKQTKKRIEIDPAPAAIVRRIVSMYLDGGGVTKICKTLNREGVASPHGRGWCRSTIYEILREARYVGEWTHGEERIIRREGGRAISEKAPEKDVIRLHRPDLAIISPDEWARVQTTIAARWTDMPSQCNAARHLLSGTLRCDACGGAMRIVVCHGRRASWTKRYYVCGDHKRTGRCPVAAHVPAQDVEPQIVEYLSGTLLRELEAKVKDEIHAEIARISEATIERASEVEKLQAEIDALRRERQRLVRLAAATDEPLSEVVDALQTNQERAKALDRALVLAARPPIDAEAAERLERAAVSAFDRMRERLSAGEAREVLRGLFPKGLRFKVGSGLWLIEGAASVPTVRDPAGRWPDSAARCNYRSCAGEPS